MPDIILKGNMKKIAYLLSVFAVLIFTSLQVTATADDSQIIEYHGLDLSHHNGEVDWPKLSTVGMRFVFIKATEGMDDKDPNFDSHWQNAEKTGIVRGAYHFYVTEDPPEKQAQFFIDTVKLSSGDLVPAVDIELLGKNTAPDVADKLQVFVNILTAHYGKKPIIYTGRTFWNKHMTDKFGQYPLWIAEYGVEKPVSPKGWLDWHFWQWTEQSTLPGVEKEVDLNYFNNRDKTFSDVLLP
ncbi:glycoside hydrolase family 25 protein [Rheinheimera baltica]|uniref:glycoside hydrolase family 25 protein n=1 Tax=Rheinheimera baltica TaxID=67576 RepID=UPI00273D1C09|nr:GH25 family lysozyme [Rheinheimera baltica]MDP5189584.1 GH25 family lysozyme [Rheinheimera baltica]